MKKLLTTLAVLTLSLSGLQAADAAAKGEKKAAMTPEERFKKFDTNADGSLTLEELKASPMGMKKPDKVDERFKMMDKDADGKVSVEEFTAASGGGAKKADKAGTAK